MVGGSASPSIKISIGCSLKVLAAVAHRRILVARAARQQCPIQTQRATRSGYRGKQECPMEFAPLYPVPDAFQDRPQAVDERITCSNRLAQGQGLLDDQVLWAEIRYGVSLALGLRDFLENSVRCPDHATARWATRIQPIAGAVEQVSQGIPDGPTLRQRWVGIERPQSSAHGQNGKRNTDVDFELTWDVRVRGHQHWRARAGRYSCEAKLMEQIDQGRDFAARPNSVGPEIIGRDFLIRQCEGRGGILMFGIMRVRATQECFGTAH